MDFEKWLTVCNFSDFTSLCYSQSVSSKLLSGKVRAPQGPLGELKIIFALYWYPWQSRESKEWTGWWQLQSRKAFKKDRKTSWEQQTRKEIWKIGPGGWIDSRPKGIPWEQLRIQCFLLRNTWILPLIWMQHISVNVYFAYLCVCVWVVVWSSQKNPTMYSVTPSLEMMELEALRC